MCAWWYSSNGSIKSPLPCTVENSICDVGTPIARLLEVPQNTTAILSSRDIPKVRAESRANVKTITITKIIIKQAVISSFRRNVVHSPSLTVVENESKTTSNIILRSVMWAKLQNR